MFGLGKKTLEEKEKAAYEKGRKDGMKEANESSVLQVRNLKDTHKTEVSKLNAKIEELNEEVEQALQSAGRSKTKIDNSPLSDKEKKKVQKTRAKLLDSLESIVTNTNANSVRGASIVKEDGDIKVLEINSKTDALDLIKRAKNGDIKIIM